MIDETNTTVDWERHSGEILILPVGAMEQHSAHLPLATDNIQVMHFADLLARDLDAALLPGLSICTSLEHTGFRGSFTLRPETLMQIINNILDLSKIEVGKLTLESVPFSIRDLVADTLKILGIRAHQKDLSLAVVC